MVTAYKCSQMLLGSGSKVLTPKAFCDKWIGRLYGVAPGEDLYRKACILEFERHLQPYGVITRDAIAKTWRWESETDNYYPKYLPAVLALADKIYSTLDYLGGLPRYEVRREYDRNQN